LCRNGVRSAVAVLDLGLPDGYGGDLIDELVDAVRSLHLGAARPAV
jgi:hypothetical protein